jgi:hypothetical protein
MRGADTGQAAGNDLASLGDELLQQAHIAVVDRVDLLHAELADLLAPEELASARTGPTGPTRSTSARTTSARGTVRTVACGTLGTVSCRTLRTVARWALWTVSRRAITCWTLGCRTFRRARCCCCCAGLFSHGFLLLSSRPAFVFSRRDRPCCQLLCVNRTGCNDAGVLPALISADCARRWPRLLWRQALLRLQAPRQPAAHSASCATREWP